MRYCIIGNSAAGIGAVEAIRKIDHEGSVIVISNELYNAYSRPLIPYFLSGKITKEKMFYRDKSFYEKNKVETMFGRNVRSINPDEKMAILEDNTKINYDKLLVATGGMPIIPEMKGLEKEGNFTFTAWDDAKKIVERVKKGVRAIVIGGGMIGLKAAESLKEIGVDVTVVIRGERVLSRILDENAALIVEDHLKEVGVNILTKNTVKEITGKDFVDGVVLGDGEKMDCDIVVIAVGVRPRLDIVKDTPIKVNIGIVVDDHMETSIPGIFAAGDVAEAYDFLQGVNRVIPIWPVAYKQGYIAGSNMAGVRLRYSGGFNMNSIELFGLPLVSVGLVNSADDRYEVFSKLGGEKSYKKVVLKDNVIVGAIFVGCIDRAGIITGLIKDKVNVGNFKDAILKDDFGYISFPRELRIERLK